MKNRVPLILILLLSILKSPAQQAEYCSVIFYNTENYFDWLNDSTVNDDEFTPDGARHWTFQRFQEKTANLSKAILAASGWDQPAIIGLCEIENRFVLEQLISKTALKNISFGIVHKESPDPRGIDVALLYNQDLFEPNQYAYFALRNENGSVRRTREILYVKGRIKSSADTLHLFVNHWPSRYSGLLETKEWRNKAGKLIKQKTDSLLNINPAAKIIVMGDFNDQANDESLRDYLEAEPPTENPVPQRLYNLSYNWGNAGAGSMKYQSQWFVFDQVIVSASLLENTNTAGITISTAGITMENFLLEPDERYGGQKPKRSYYGFNYEGGFSDHLPVKVRLRIR